MSRSNLLFAATCTTRSTVGIAARPGAQLSARSVSSLGMCVQPSKIRGGNTGPVAKMVDLMGSTPVLNLNMLTSKVGALCDRPLAKQPEIFVKLESLNPGWSVKARPAMHMIEMAEKRGDIGPNTVIVESSSGNTAIAMAMVAAMKGYAFKPIVDIKMPQAKLDLLLAFGADIEIVGDPSIPPEQQDMTQLKKDRRATVQRVLEELGDRGYNPNQYANPDNAGSHMLSTGPELIEQMDGDIDALIMPISTGGQINGIGRFIKEHIPYCHLVGTEPIGSTILHETPGSYYNAGSGLDYAPLPVEHMLTDGLIDEGWAIEDAASFKMSRMLAKTTGALLGPSTGMQVFAALALAIENPSIKRIVVVGCDDGRAYVPDMMAAKQANELDTFDELDEMLKVFNKKRIASAVIAKSLLHQDEPIAANS